MSDGLKVCFFVPRVCNHHNSLSLHQRKDVKEVILVISKVQAELKGLASSVSLQIPLICLEYLNLRFLNELVD